MPGTGIAPARRYADRRAHRHEPALEEGASRGRSLWIIPALSGVVAGITSVGRLWLANPEVLGQVLWAEDGLFPLCAMQSGFLTCLFEPFAGYLLFAPRVIAGLVALMPLVDWATFANGIAAAVAGIIAFTVTWHLMGQRFGKVASFAVGQLPVLLPLVGLESINSIGSMYMLMLFLVFMMVALPSPGTSSTWLTAALIVITALTIPSVIVVAFIVALLLLRSWIEVRQARIWLISLGVGLLPQALVIITAEERRPLETSASALLAWMDGVATASVSLIPGLALMGRAPSFDALEVVGWQHPGVIMTLAAVGAGVIAYLRTRRPLMGQLSVLALAGVLASLIPAAISGPSNRYFVIPLLCWVAALLLALDDWARRRSRSLLVPGMVLVLGLLWWPALPASPFRASSAPDWSIVVTRAQAECGLKPNGTASFLFSPNWPYGDGGLPMPRVLPCWMVQAKLRAE